MQRIDLKESDWRSSIAKAKAMDWLIRHRVAGKSSVEVDNYVEKLCTHSCEVERSSVVQGTDTQQACPKVTVQLLHSCVFQTCNGISFPKEQPC